MRNGNQENLELQEKRGFKIIMRYPSIRSVQLLFFEVINYRLHFNQKNTKSQARCDAADGSDSVVRGKIGYQQQNNSHQTEKYTLFNAFICKDKLSNSYISLINIFHCS